MGISELKMRKTQENWDNFGHPSSILGAEGAGGVKRF